MKNGKWGHCKNCKYFASPAEVPLEDEEARCTQPKLAAYALTVFGACGCSAFELRSGLPASVEKSAASISSAAKTGEHIEARGAS